MARNSIIIELTSANQPDLTALIGNERAVVVSRLLNSSREYLYITNCKNMFEQIRFELLPVAKNQLFLVELDASDNSNLFTNNQLNDVMRQATNILLNVNGDFEKQLRDKFILYAMSNTNVNLSLLPSPYLVSKDSRRILVYPNGVHNVVVSAVSNELKSEQQTKFTIATDKQNAKPLYLALLNLYKLNAYELDASLVVAPKPLTDVNPNKYTKVYIEHGIGFSKDDVEKVMEIAESIPQLFITNHKVLFNYTSSEISMSGIITDSILDRLQSQVKQPRTQESSSFNHSSAVGLATRPVESSTLISSNPLD